MLRKYYVMLADGAKCVLEATELQVRDGVLTFTHGAVVVAVYAAGVWSSVELEEPDEEG